MQPGLVLQHGHEPGPPGVVDGLGQAGAPERLDRQVFHGDRLVVADQRRGQLVVEVPPGVGCPGVRAGEPRTAQPGWSASMTPMPVPSAKGASTARSSSATRPRSPTTTTASSWTTAWSPARSPTGRNSRPPSSGSASALAAYPPQSPLTAAMASPPSSATCKNWGCGPSPSPARPRPHQPARPSSTAAASTGSSNADRLRRADQLPQTRIRLGPYPPRWQGRSRDLVRSRRLCPQPNQDRGPGQLTQQHGNHRQQTRPYDEDFFRSK